MKDVKNAENTTHGVPDGDCFLWNASQERQIDELPPIACALSTTSPAGTFTT
jgi:hypothetical protein